MAYCGPDLLSGLRVARQRCGLRRASRASRICTCSPRSPRPAWPELSPVLDRIPGLDCALRAGAVARRRMAVFLARDRRVLSLRNHRLHATVALRDLVSGLAVCDLDLGIQDPSNCPDNLGADSRYRISMLLDCRRDPLRLESCLLRKSRQPLNICGKPAIRPVDSTPSVTRPPPSSLIFPRTYTPILTTSERRLLGLVQAEHCR